MGIGGRAARERDDDYAKSNSRREREREREARRFLSLIAMGKCLGILDELICSEKGTLSFPRSQRKRTSECRTFSIER